MIWKTLCRDSRLQQKKYFQWFSDNKKKANADKSRFISKKLFQNTDLTVGNEENANNICVMLLGVKIDSKPHLTFTLMIFVRKRHKS